jgi:hypothetical protein
MYGCTVAVPWEDPDDPTRPSVSKLRKLARAYERTLPVSYLDEPSLDFQPVRNFRRLVERSNVDGVPGRVRPRHSTVSHPNCWKLLANVRLETFVSIK